MTAPRAQTAPDTVVVHWKTNFPTSHRLVFGKESVTNNLLPPLFGYSTSTAENPSQQNIEHDVVVSGLKSGATYFFRPVSRSGTFEQTGPEVSATIGSAVAPTLGNIVASASGGEECAIVTGILRQDGDNNTLEVRSLQEFLINQGFVNVAVTGVFDQNTFDAVKAFQELYSDEILAPWGVNEGTGIVYITTRKKINELSCGKNFALTPEEEKIIADTRAGLNAPAGGEEELIGVGGPETPIDSFVFEDTGNPSPLAVGSVSQTTATTTATTTPAVSAPGNLAKLAAAILSLPSSGKELALYTLVFLLILAVVYIISTATVNNQNTAALSIRQVRTRKLILFIVGTVIAIIGSLFFRGYHLVVPLLVVLIILAVGLLWYSNKKDKSFIFFE